MFRNSAYRVRDKIMARNETERGDDPTTSHRAPPTAVPAPGVPADSVAIDDVTLIYKGTATGVVAVRDLSLTVRRGEFAAVVGPSGCGKSSLMKLVTGLVPPNSGNIVVFGDKVRGPLKIAGMAFQNPNLLPWRKVIDNVMLPLEIVEPHRRRFRAEKATYRAQAQRLLATVGLADSADQFPWQLSGGMQQRVSLCRALIHQPALLMLDEPFAALDAFTREELWCVLRDLWAELGFTVILVTHDLREAAFLGSRICVMSARPGRILDDSPVTFARPRTVEMTFEPDFVALNQKLRAFIVDARTASARGAI